ncbi:MAG: TonB-dependent siderophore receptor [Alphaproteobacteria bacterium]|nr:TonB-dependent siderophore receptor [Alphaproteobacteria bacterium]
MLYIASTLLARTAFAASLAAVHAGAASAQTAPAGGGEKVLGSVTVTDTPIDEPEAQTSYKVSRTISATRTDTSLIDVTQSVNIVSVKQIEDQAANNIGDAIRYVPGIFSAQGEGNRETLVLRGNSTTGDFFVDGMRDDVQTYRDLYNIERLEVFRGPNAMIFGRGGVGGVINRVTKAADWQPVRSIRLEGGSDDHYRDQIDFGAPLSDTAALRLSGVYQNSGSYRDGVSYERWGFNPTASFRLGDTTLVTVGYEHFDDQRVADRGVSSYLGAPLRTPRGQFFGDPEQSPTGTNTDAATLFVEHRFSDTVVLRNRTRYADYDKFYQNVFAGTVNSVAQVNPAGLPAGTYGPGTIVQILGYNNATRRKNMINQTDLNAKFSTGAIEHVLLVGAELGRQKTDNLRLEACFPAAEICVVPGANSASVRPIFAPIGAPTISPDIVWRPIASSGDNKGTATVAAAYVQDQVSLSPMFDLVLGVRFEHFTTKVTDRRTVGFPIGQQRDFKVTDDLWSPRGGIIFKPAENASVYASYSRTYLPRGGDQLAGLNLSNQSLAPEKYQNYELGAKWDIVPTFNVSAALFQLDRDNVLALSNPNNPASATIPIGRQRTKGVELSAAGSVTEQLSLVGAYTYSDGKFRDSISGTVQAGNILPNMPKHSASLWTRFDPLTKLGLGLGVIHQGKRYAATDNAVVMPSYTRVDAAIYYTIDDQFSAQLNVENLLNERYFLYANSNTNITPGSPTAFKIGLNARF